MAQLGSRHWVLRHRLREENIGRDQTTRRTLAQLWVRFPSTYPHGRGPSRSDGPIAESIWPACSREAKAKSVNFFSTPVSKYVQSMWHHVFELAGPAVRRPLPDAFTVRLIAGATRHSALLVHCKTWVFGLSTQRACRVRYVQPTQYARWGLVALCLRLLARLLAGGRRSCTST
jgi:hypothetical protein